MQTYLIRNMKYKDINPIEAGHQKCAPNYSFGYYMRNHYLFHYIVSGSGVLYKNYTEYPVKKGQAFLIRPGEITKYTADKDTPWEYIWVGFTGELAKLLEDFPETVFDAKESTFEKIKNCYKYSNMREAYLASCIHLLLCDIFETDTAVDTVSVVKNYIDTNYINNLKISDIAKKVNLNRKYLAKIFKFKTGFTMQEYIVKKKMEASRELLNSGFNVNETSEMTGYSDQSAFSRAYKNYFGEAPKNQAK